MPTTRGGFVTCTKRLIIAIELFPSRSAASIAKSEDSNAPGLDSAEALQLPGSMNQMPYIYTYSFTQDAQHALPMPASAYPQFAPSTAGLWGQQMPNTGSMNMPSTVTMTTVPSANHGMFLSRSRVVR